MKVVIEINSKFVKALLTVALVLAVLVLAKSLFNVGDVVANGFYQGPTGKYINQHLGNYPDMHLFKRVGARIECVGACKLDEKNRTYTWVKYNKN